MFTKELVSMASAIILLLGIDPAALVAGELRPADLACSTSGPVELGSTGACRGCPGIGVAFRSDFTMEIANHGGKPISGCLTMTDENGDPVGDPQDLTIPGGGSITVSVPGEATDWELTDEPCGGDDDDDEDDGNDGSGETRRSDGPDSGCLELGDAQQQGGKIRRRKHAHSFLGGPLDPDPFGRNVSYSFTVCSFDRGAAREMKDAILEGGLSSALPAIRGVDRVEVDFYLESSMNVFGDLVMTFANDDVFATLDITLNGDASYASLADGTAVSTSNGWDAVRFLIPSGDLIYDPTSGARWRNDFDVAFSAAGDPGDSHFTGYFEFESD